MVANGFGENEPSHPLIYTTSLLNSRNIPVSSRKDVGTSPLSDAMLKADTSRAIQLNDDGVMYENLYKHQLRLQHFTSQDSFEKLYQNDATQVDSESDYEMKITEELNIVEAEVAQIIENNAHLETDFGSLMPIESVPSVIRVCNYLSLVNEKSRIALLIKYFLNLCVVRQAPQLIALLTVLRDCNTSNEEFAFYGDRVIRLVLEETLNLFPFVTSKVKTPSGYIYHGLCFSSRICGVALIRAGESMERGLRAVCKGCRIGKILVDLDASGKYECKFMKLPQDIASRKILLLYPLCATSGTLCFAIKLLISQNVPQENIIVVCLFAAPIGIFKMLFQFPKVHLVCAAVEAQLDENQLLVPGIGNFGDRYFGTFKHTKL